MRHSFGLFLLLSLSLSAHAQTGKAPWEEFDKRLKASQKVAPLGNNAFGDEVSLSNGALSFSATDVSIPGNSGLPVAFGRSYTVRDWRHRTTPGMMADWDVDVPRISGVYVEAQGWVSTTGTQARCTLGGAPPSPYVGLHTSDFWQGANLNIPGVGGGELLSTLAGAPRPHPASSYPWMTSEQIHLSCLSTIKNGAGEGFLAVTPDGTKYWFDWMGSEQEPPLRRGTGQQIGVTATATPLRRMSLYATRVEDRFGNFVTYTYSNAAGNPGRLTSVTGNDGRQITVAYNGNGHVASVNDGTRTWSYSYASAAAGRRTLTAVTLPDLSAWAINFAPFTNAEVLQTEVFMLGEIYRSCYSNEVPLNAALQPVGTITHPSGVVGTFTIFITEHGRSSVPLSCNNVILGPGGPNINTQNDTNDDSPFWPISYYAFTLKSKQVSGPGLAPSQWDYSYTSGKSYYMYPGTTRARPVCTPFSTCMVPPCQSEACAGSSTTSVTGPNNERTVYTYGNTYRYDEGKLKKVEVGTVAGPVQRTTVYSYDLAREPTTQVYMLRWGLGSRANGDSFPNEYHRPLLSTKTTQQGVDFTRTVTAFDQFARPTAETQASTLGYSRTASTVYRDNWSSWVIGQVAERYLAGTLMERTTFHGNDLPWQLYGPGNTIVQTLTFNADGTIATAMDANNRITTVSNWYRGIPTSVLFADGTGMSAEVTSLGWVTKVTQPESNVRSFTYDAMGRVTAVSQPPGDTVAWAPTTIAFTKVAAAEYGIAAGHWRETVSTGNARKETYFDALWRPLLVREYDTANVAGTSRFTVQGYDHEGRPNFSAYPLANLGSIANATLGVWTQYDALGRSTSVGQDSDGPTVLVSQTNYLAGFQTQSVNPLGFATLMQFQAFDTPDISAPTLIQSPEGATTTIVRDALGRATSLTRSGPWAGQTRSVTRHYTYDAQMRLCRTTEPETGATVMDYDAAGNLVWSAAGLTSLPAPPNNTCTADRASAYASGRRVDRTYDARNRLSTLSFPDGRGNQTWAYTADGLPSQITTNNASGGQQVVNTYIYNRRRLLESEQVSQPGWYTWGITYGYDANGSLASHRYPTGLVVDYAPNAQGQATQAGTWATGVQYHPNGAVKQFSYGNGLVHTMTQNARQLPLSSIDSGGALNQTYKYDYNGNVTEVNDALDDARDRLMVYDGLDRLTKATSASFGGNGIHQFTYDPLDNLRSWTLGGVKDLATYFYDPNNRLTSVLNTGGAVVHSFAYDVQGNLTDKNSVPHDFDFGNRLRAVTGLESYRYDGLGRRVMSAKASGAQTLWQYSQTGQLLFAWKGPTAQTTHEYVYLAGSLVATIDHAWPSNAITATKYQHTDALGSPIAMSNEAGVIPLEWRTNYDPYGGPINKTIDGIGYTGHVMDPLTGLTNMQQRYYDQGVGRFLSVDPVSASSINGGNFNRYKYAFGNPYRFYDPDGRAEASLFDVADHDGLFHNTTEAFDRPGSFDFGGHGNERIVQDQSDGPQNAVDMDAYALFPVLRDEYGLKRGQEMFSISCRFGLAGANGTQAQIMANLNKSVVYGADGWVNFRPIGNGKVELTVWSERERGGKQGAFQQFRPGGSGPVRGSEIIRIVVNLGNSSATATVRHEQPRTGTRIKTENIRLKSDMP